MQPHDSQELYRNRVGALYQSPSAMMFYLDFQGVLQPFTPRQFQQLKAYLLSFDPAKMLTAHSPCDTEVVYLPSMNVLVIMRLHELIGLKDLFCGASTMLDLNSILYQRIYNVLI